MPTVYPGARSAFGIGKETTPGTAVAAARFPALSKFDPVDKPMPLIDDGYRGSMASEYGLVLGPEWCEGDFSGPVHTDALGDYLYNILGDYAVGAPVSSVYPHTFGLLNSGTGQPVTHTFIDSQQVTASVGARVYPYACLSELTLSGDAEGLFQVAGKFSSFPSAAAGSSMTNTPTAEIVIPAWRSTLTLATVATANVAEWSVTLSRELVVQPTADGTQAPYAIGRGDLKASFKLNLIAADEAPLTTLLTNVQPAAVLTINNGGATTALRELVITMTKAAYTDVTQKRDTLISWDITGKAIANSTDGAASGGLSPLKCVLKNALTTY